MLSQNRFHTQDPTLHDHAAAMATLPPRRRRPAGAAAARLKRRLLRNKASAEALVDDAVRGVPSALGREPGLARERCGVARLERLERDLTSGRHGRGLCRTAERKALAHLEPAGGLLAGHNENFLCESKAPKESKGHGGGGSGPPGSRHEVSTFFPNLESTAISTHAGELPSPEDTARIAGRHEAPPLAHPHAAAPGPRIGPKPPHERGSQVVGAGPGAVPGPPGGRQGAPASGVPAGG